MGLMDGRKLASPLLQQIRQDVEGKLPEGLKRDYLAIVVAGLKVMYSDETHAMAVKAMNEAAKRNPLPRAAILATLTLMGMIYKESQGKMSFPAAIPAAVVLLAYVLEYLQATTKQEFSAQDVARATAGVTSGLFKLFGVTQEQLTQATQQGGATPATQPKASTPAQVPPVGQAATQGGA